MALYLVQHGKSLPKDIDPEKGLSEEGGQEVLRMTNVAENYGVNVQKIKHSGKTRAKQTAEKIAGILGKGQQLVEEMPGLKPLDPVEPIAESLKPEDNLMLVGHLPFMQRLTGYLTVGDTSATVFKFQNAGIVCLDKDEEEGVGWYIKWTLMPNID
jgi:phosphohistidine phosphatase